MGGSSSREYVASRGPTSGSRQQQNIPDDIRKAIIGKSDRFIVDDISEQMRRVEESFKTFNMSSPEDINQYVNKINNYITTQGQGTPITLSPEIKQAMTDVHDALVRKLDVSGYSDSKERNAKVKEKLREMPIDEMFANIKEQFGSDIDVKKERIYKDLNIGETPIKANIDTIFDTVKSLKVKYKFFEYKYIELNLFMILFTQQVYETLQKFITSVSMFNKVRDETREQLIQDAFKAMNDLLGQSGVDISGKDYDGLKVMMTSLQQNLAKKDQELKDNLNKVIQITSTDMKDFVNLLSDATKTSLKDSLNRPQGGGNSQAFFDLKDS
jgi:hypothetical protein